MFGGKCCEFPRDRLQCGAMEEIGGRTTFMNLNFTSDAKEASIFNLFIFQIRVSCICRKVVVFGIEWTMKGRDHFNSLRSHGLTDVEDFFLEWILMTIVICSF